MQETPNFRGSFYFGLLFSTLSTLMFQVLLTRIFSVTMWYHFAFMAVSVAMFGMTVGALLVHLKPNYFTKDKTQYHLVLYSFLFGLAIIFSFMSHLSILFSSSPSLLSAFALLLTFIVISIPFVFGGICVTLALTRFPERVHKLYAADLTGAAIGCIILIILFEFSDGPTLVFVSALFAFLSALFFAFGLAKPRLKITLGVIFCFTLVFCVVNSILATNQNALIRPLWVKGVREAKPIWEKWNSFSRIIVTGDTSIYKPAFGWGFGLDTAALPRIKQADLNIDANAATILTNFSGNFDSVSYLKADVTNAAYYLNNSSDALIIGSGGGRDILSALSFGCKKVTAVEMNPNIIDAMSKVFGDFTGFSQKRDDVELVCDEARSWLARSGKNFDIIQVSLIDTWAATSAGAFVLTEHSLYTQEAWNNFFNHLTDNGLLSFSRWFYLDKSVEILKTATLAASCLKANGIDEPRKHVLIIKNHIIDTKELKNSTIGSIIVSKSPFTEDKLLQIKQISDSLNFKIILSPDTCEIPLLEAIFNPSTYEKAIDDYSLDISPPTDNKPYFFFTAKIMYMLNPFNWSKSDIGLNIKAIFVLVSLFVIVVVLTVLCIVLPLFAGTKKESFSGALRYFIFFISIGFGFMFVEISQIQRLSLFLGHPVYGLSVLLFSLLLSSGIGSWLSGRLQIKKEILFVALLLMIILFGSLTPHLISYLSSSTNPTRITASVFMIFPLGIFMGMMFPLGLSEASVRHSGITPWLWGVNGATSVCGSVAAVIICIIFGISAAFWLGLAFYIIAALSMLVGRKQGS
jgi:hypothetical protein